MAEKIVFFGRNKDYKITQLCFIELLKHIKNTPHQVVAAVVSDDHHGMTDTLEAIAQRRRIHWLSAESNDINEHVFIKKLAEFKPTLFIVVQFPQILGRGLLSLPKRGALNIHRGWPLRGGSIDERAIYNKLSNYNVILQHLNSGIDTGNIIGKIGFPLARKEDGYSLVKKADTIGRKVFSKYFLPLIGSSIPKGEKQDIKQTTYDVKGSISSRIDLSRGANDIERLCRAFYHPRKSGAYITIGGEVAYLIPPIKIISEPAYKKPGTIISLNKSAVILATDDLKILVSKCYMSDNMPESFGAFLMGKGIKAGDCLLEESIRGI